MLWRPSVAQMMTRHRRDGATRRSRHAIEIREKDEVTVPDRKMTNEYMRMAEELEAPM